MARLEMWSPQFRLFDMDTPRIEMASFLGKMVVFICNVLFAGSCFLEKMQVCVLDALKLTKFIAPQLLLAGRDWGDYYRDLLRPGVAARSAAML